MHGRRTASRAAWAVDACSAFALSTSASDRSKGNGNALIGWPGWMESFPNEETVCHFLDVSRSARIEWLDESRRDVAHI